MSYFPKFGYAAIPCIKIPPSKNLKLSVVIPACDEPYLIRALQSLYDCEQSGSVVEVIVVVNAGEDADSGVLLRNQKSITELHEWKTIHSRDNFFVHIIEELKLPKKHAGVGLARKIGMDEAAYRFNLINYNGIIICFDADCVCDKNYLKEVEKQFDLTNAFSASIYFEHPLDGAEYENEVYTAITYYELFLRYYVEALRYARYPYAFHTIGSSMAVKSNTYQKQGGMNKRKAGEDFYFLHKVIPLGNFIEINSTRIIASPRPSHRVPFGTGRAVSKWLTEKPEVYKTYSLKTFNELKLFFEMLPDIYNNKINFENLPLSIKKFTGEEPFLKKIDELKNNSTNYDSFFKRFYNWWDGFMVLKFVHYSRDNFFPDESILLELKKILLISVDEINAKELLFVLRDIQRKKPAIKQALEIN